MSVGLDGAGSVGVDTRGVLALTLAILECAVLNRGGAVVGDTDTVINVLAEAGGVGSGRVTDLEAELVAAHEAVRTQISTVTDISHIRTNLCHS